LEYLEELMQVLDEKETAIQERKDVLHRVWNYETVDHIPVLMSVEWLPGNKTYRQEFEDGQLVF